MSTTEIATAHPASTHRRRWWPTAAGVVLAAVMGWGVTDGTELAPVLTAAAFVYLGAAALQRPSASWPVFLASFVVMAVAKVVGGDRPCSPWSS